MFWTSERVNWREEATGVGARKQSTVVIHAIEEGTGTGVGTSAGNDAVETFVCTGTGTGVHVSTHAGACAGRCTGTCTGVRTVHAEAHALAGARARESRQGPRGTLWHQARRQCAAPSPSMPRGWALAQSGRRKPERERGQAQCLPARPVQALPKAAYVLETLDGCLPQETGRLRADHRDAAWHTFRSASSGRPCGR